MRNLLSFLLFALPGIASADLLTFSAPNGSWAAAQATGITDGARSMRVSNPLTVPINVRWGADGDSGSALFRLGAGDVATLTFTDGERPAEVAVYGDGGTGSVYVETFGGANAVITSDRVTVGLSSASPQGPGTAAAGTSTLGSPADHVHPLQTEGAIASALGSEAGNTIRVTLTVTDAAGTTVGSELCWVELYTAAMAYVDGSSNGAFSLVTGTAQTTNAPGANVRMLITAASGVIKIDVIDKSGFLTGNLIALVSCPSVGAVKAVAVTFA